MEFKIRKIGLFPRLFLLWVVLLYYSQMLPIRHEYSEVIIGGIVIFTGGLLFLKCKIAEKRVSKSSLLLLIYFSFLLSALSITSVISVDPTSSFLKGIYSTGMYLLVFFIFKKMNELYIMQANWRNKFSNSFLISMLIIIVGQLVLPEWKTGVGGVRLSGGTNPNLVSFFSFFVIFISHYNSLINARWFKIDKVNWLLANIILIWSMSRSGYLGYGVFYMAYIGWFFIIKDVSLLLKGKITKRLLKRTLLMVLIIPIIGLFYNRFKNTGFYHYTVLRVTGESGITTRTNAWEILLSYYKQNPLLGGVGWWNASDVLPNVVGMASSPHSLYVRLLSEVGIIGTVAVLALPIFIVLGLVIKSGLANDPKKEKMMVLTSSFLFGAFALQFFEDKFLTGIFGMGNNILIWVMAIGYLLLSKDIPVKAQSIVVNKKKHKKYY